MTGKREDERIDLIGRVNDRPDTESSRERENKRDVTVGRAANVIATLGILLQFSQYEHDGDLYIYLEIDEVPLLPKMYEVHRGLLESYRIRFTIIVPRNIEK